MNITLLNKSKHQLEAYSAAIFAGKEIRANNDTEIVLRTMERTGDTESLFLKNPVGYKSHRRSTGELALKKRVNVLKSIDNIDYRGEDCIVMEEFSIKDFVIEGGERFCQMVISKQEQAEWESVDNLSEAERGAGGFGNTGKE